MAHVAFQNVSKIYTKQSRQFFFSYFLEVLGRKRKPQELFYALRDVSFEVGRGDTLGIVGHNGAGKSTLLSLVAGLTVPEEGSVSVSGRVMAMLELGSGFHPDLTGMENLRMNAALCGLTKEETLAASERILEFSELGDFIHEPIRTYSQGMVLRLAFSIAVHVEPDILLLDEILAVGDKDFQKKCLKRVMELRDSGTILLIVSHIPTLLQEFCKKGLWIEKGGVIMQGEASEVFNAYLDQNGGTPAA
jgi:ABC-type polysaccharide/polyol phosphate transport system ATPase subunit